MRTAAGAAVDEAPVVGGPRCTHWRTRSIKAAAFSRVMPASASSSVAQLSSGLHNRDGAADVTRASDANLCLPILPLGGTFGVRGYNSSAA